MSIMRCEKHQEFYDSDWVSECKYCDSEPTINWQKVWRAMHDLHYRRIRIMEAIDLASAAGHPKPAKLAMKTLESGYLMARE